jgi:crossover junction endodeoxyribonuclease RusA
MITIKGRVISKKNSKQVVRTGGRPYIISSKAYQAFEKEAVKQIKRQFRGNPYEGPVDVCYSFFMKGRLDTDISNMIGSIDDILEKAGVIENDRNIVSMSAVKEAGHEGWLTEVEITKLV